MVVVSLSTRRTTIKDHRKLVLHSPVRWDFYNSANRLSLASCKWYKVFEFGSENQYGFKYGGEEHWSHDIIFDPGSSLVKIIWPEHDYDAGIYNCVLEQSSWNSSANALNVQRRNIFPISKGEYCENSDDWKFVKQDFDRW